MLQGTNHSLKPLLLLEQGGHGNSISGRSQGIRSQGEWEHEGRVALGGSCCQRWVPRMEGVRKNLHLICWGCLLTKPPGSKPASQHSLGMHTAGIIIRGWKAGIWRWHKGTITGTIGRNLVYLRETKGGYWPLHWGLK